MNAVLELLKLDLSHNLPLSPYSNLVNEKQTWKTYKGGAQLEIQLIVEVTIYFSPNKLHDCVQSSCLPVQPVSDKRIRDKAENVLTLKVATVQKREQLITSTLTRINQIENEAVNLFEQPL